MKLRFSPTLFLFLEFFILLPSFLFVFGLIWYFITQDPSMYFLVTSQNMLQNIGVTIISPLSGGFLAYQYLERYHPKGFIRLKAKGILAYSIVVIGLVLAYFFLIKSA